MSPTLATAEDFPFNVKPNNEFIVELFIFGSTQVTAAASWKSRNADLDIVGLCENDVVFGSLSSERYLELMSLGLVDNGDGLLCLLGVFSASGRSKGALNIFLGQVPRVSTPASAAVAGQGVSEELRRRLRERIHQMRSEKRRAARE